MNLSRPDGNPLGFKWVRRLRRLVYKWTSDLVVNLIMIFMYNLAVVHVGYHFIRCSVVTVLSCAAFWCRLLLLKFLVIMGPHAWQQLVNIKVRRESNCHCHEMTHGKSKAARFILPSCTFTVFVSHLLPFFLKDCPEEEAGGYACVLFGLAPLPWHASFSPWRVLSPTFSRPLPVPAREGKESQKGKVCTELHAA